MGEQAPGELQALGSALAAAVFEAIEQITSALRRAGVVVSTAQLLDAVRAAAVIDVADRDQFRMALRSTLVKRQEHLPVFEAAFAATLLPAPVVTGGRSPTRTGSLSDDLVLALQSGDLTALRSLAGLAVEMFAGLSGDQLCGERYHLRRTLQRLDLTELLSRSIQLAAQGDDGPSVTDLQARLAALEGLVVQEVRRRLLASDAISSLAVPDVNDIDFMEATPAELALLRETVRPLARHLAARLARRRQHHSSPRVEMRRTLRRSLASGGVPVDLAFHRPRHVRPELVVLADISGSVAEFARFFILLLHALHEELPHVRSFCFVDGVDEVTHLLESSPNSLEVRHLVATTRVVSDSGHSDYGAVLEGFLNRYSSALGPRTTVLIAGDARSNGRDPRTEILDEVHQKVRRLYWLNPEPQAMWDTRDSVISRYAPACSDVVEVRKVRQLADFVLSLA